MRFLSICSGIESASVAWEPLGFQPVGFSEIEPFPCRVLEHHYPNVKNYGDLTKWREWDVPEKPDIIVGGTPCQDFSIAGKREEGARANLTHEFIELCGALRPEWVVWENVPGVLSMDSGRTFHRILRKFSECGYGWAYRVLDAQFFGVPQRRRRVFFVGHSSGDPRRAGEVLFEREGLSGDFEKGREKRKEATERIGERFDYECGCGYRFEGYLGKYGCPNCEGEFIAKRILSQKIFRLISFGEYIDDNKSSTRLAHDSKDNTDLIVFEPRSQDGIPRVSKDGKCPTLNTAQGGQRQPCVAFAQNQRDEVRLMDKVGALCSQPGMKQQTYIAFTQNDGGRDATKNITPTLRSGGDGGLPQMCVAKRHWVRRITPTEALRLQGFPDDYLINVPSYSDTQAYRAIGNSKAVPVVRWIGKRMLQSLG